MGIIKKLNKIPILNSYTNMTDSIDITVYKWHCKNPEVDRYYIGSTVDYSRRHIHHKFRTNHITTEYDNVRNPELYNYVRDSGGYENWTFAILEECKVAGRYEREQLEFRHIDAVSDQSLLLNQIKRPAIEGGGDLVTEQCKFCFKHITRCNMPRHIATVHNPNRVGPKFYTFNKQRNKYVAVVRIPLAKSTTTLGYFDTPEEARQCSLDFIANGYKKNVFDSSEVIDDDEIIDDDQPIVEPNPVVAPKYVKDKPIKHGKNKTIQCPYCPKVIGRYNLSIHVRNLHPDEPAVDITNL